MSVGTGSSNRPKSPSLLFQFGNQLAIISMLKKDHLFYFFLNLFIILIGNI
jgi:hypothetical protein